MAPTLQHAAARGVESSGIPERSRISASRLHFAPIHDAKGCQLSGQALASSLSMGGPRGAGGRCPMQDGTRLREAFARAAAGRQKSIAAEAFADRSVAQAESELSAILSGSRRPTWTLIAELLALSPPALLDMVGELARVRWERLPDSEAVSLARIDQHLEQLELG